jgi:hypothetical protein
MNDTGLCIVTLNREQPLPVHANGPRVARGPMWAWSRVSPCSTRATYWLDGAVAARASARGFRRRPG